MPDLLVVDLFKMANTICSVVCTILIFAGYRYHLLFQRLQLHLTQGLPNEAQTLLVDAKEIFAQPLFWLEAALCLIHLPPFCTFEIGAPQMDNWVMYRVEAIFCVINTFRIYLLGRVFKAWSLRKFKRLHQVASATSTHVGYGFVIKRAFVGTNAAYSCAALWASMLFITAYWYRIAETQGCTLASATHEGCQRPEAKQWSLYGEPILQNSGSSSVNALWLVFVASTTVGYGDMYPVTHIGRVVTVIASLSGVSIASFMTAACSNAIGWSEGQERALLMLRRRRAQIDITSKAQVLIAAYYRRRKFGDAYSSKFRQARREFRQLKEVCHEDLDNGLLNTSQLLNTLLALSRSIESEITSLGAANDKPVMVKGDTEQEVATQQG